MTTENEEQSLALLEAGGLQSEAVQERLFLQFLQRDYGLGPTQAKLLLALIQNQGQEFRWYKNWAQAAGVGDQGVGRALLDPKFQEAIQKVQQGRLYGAYHDMVTELIRSAMSDGPHSAKDRRTILEVMGLLPRAPQVQVQVGNNVVLVEQVVKAKQRLRDADAQGAASIEGGSRVVKDDG